MELVFDGRANDLYTRGIVKWDAKLTISRVSHGRANALATIRIVRWNSCLWEDRVFRGKADGSTQKASYNGKYAEWVSYLLFTRGRAECF